MCSPSIGGRASNVKIGGNICTTLFRMCYPLMTSISFFYLARAGCSISSCCVSYYLKIV
ncbi:hypothetical protein QJS10_CPA10g01529 [Acorus calamus]|uniref:Uncharacterized protein n=1 Tax=Acorus calamus TaxID=4465 RepID=A0AAV9E0F7_ACOCL|nr:hypothetical protein QJS10_CPA10g01529 [Acorus calamus]